MSSGNKVLKYSIALMAMSVSIANAVPVSISTGYQNEGFGQFSGTIDYAAASSNSATLTLTLKNEAGTAAGGKITGVALNLPDASGITGLISGAPNNSWSQLGINQNAVSADPLGAFDFGEALGGSWLGGGSPNAGIVIGATGTFVFNFSGNGLNNLTTSSFLNAFAPGYSAGSAEFMAVRFRGFDNGGSDKVGANASPPPPVPVPSSVWLLISGIGGLGVIGKKVSKCNNS